MRSLFISAPYPGSLKFSGQPTGLLYALTQLADRKRRERGGSAKAREEIEVWCPDGTSRYDGSELARQLDAHLSDQDLGLVGVSTFSASYRNAVEILRHVKRRCPRAIVVFGGAHEDNSIKYYRRRGSIDADFVIGGDGMFLLDELCALLEESPGLEPGALKERVTEQRSRFEALPGAGVLLYEQAGGLRSIETQSHVPARHRQVMRLDQVPLMPRHLMRDEEEVSSRFSAFPGMKTAQVIIGQGCPYRCPFCSEAIKKVWNDVDAPASIEPVRDLAHVEAELVALRESGYRAIFFDDSTFLAKPMPYMQRLLELLRGYKLEWGCQTTQSSLRPFAGLLPAMAEAGLRYVYMGVEHFDGRIIDTFGKKAGAGDKFGAFDVEATIERLRRAGVRAGLSLTFGHPDLQHPRHVTRETQETVRFTVDAVRRLIERFSDTVAGVSLNLVTYHPGTIISEEFERRGLGELDFVGHPNDREPYQSFEEGLGPHAPGVTDELTSFILEYSREHLGNKLYIG